MKFEKSTLSPSDIAGSFNKKNSEEIENVEVPAPKAEEGKEGSSYFIKGCI